MNQRLRARETTVCGLLAKDSTFKSDHREEFIEALRELLGLSPLYEGLIACGYETRVRNQRARQERELNGT